MGFTRYITVIDKYILSTNSFSIIGQVVAVL